MPGSASIVDSKVSGSPILMKATGPKSVTNDTLNRLSNGCWDEYNAESIPVTKLATGSKFPSRVLGKTTLTWPAASAAPNAV